MPPSWIDTGYFCLGGEMAMLLLSFAISARNVLKVLFRIGGGGGGGEYPPFPSPSVSIPAHAHHVTSLSYCKSPTCPIG